MRCPWDSVQQRNNNAQIWVKGTVLEIWFRFAYSLNENWYQLKSRQTYWVNLKPQSSSKVKFERFNSDAIHLGSFSPAKNCLRCSDHSIFNDLFSSVGYRYTYIQIYIYTYIIFIHTYTLIYIYIYTHILTDKTYTHTYIYIYINPQYTLGTYIYIYIYLYIYCDWQHWQRMSSTQSTKALSDCFPFQATSLITVQIGDRPRGSKSYPNSRQRLDAKCSYGFLGTPGPKQ